MSDAPGTDVPKGMIVEVRINFLIHRPNERSLRCSSFITSRASFPSLEALLIVSIEQIKKEYKDALFLNEG